MVDFTGQVAIVTGAGRGLGRHYAIELARLGASVVVNDHGGTTDGRGADASIADGVVDEIRRAGGIAIPSHESVASPETGEAIVRRAVDEFGRLDALVSNAGIFRTRDFEQLSAADWRRMLGVDGALGGRVRTWRSTSKRCKRSSRPSRNRRLHSDAPRDGRGSHQGVTATFDGRDA
jgi:NAD(P)-dependent dehydrogenase (short-subunit alcohol dehydrogenase family)